MATRTLELPVETQTVLPLSCADEQARILRATVSHRPDSGPVVLDDDLTLDAWECSLLHGETQNDRWARGVARTLLRARAAEWAVSRRLKDPGKLTAETLEEIALLLDQTLADIGAATELPECEATIGLEETGRRLADLYESVSDMSLRLLGRRTPDTTDYTWRLRELSEDPFELGDSDPRAPITRWRANDAGEDDGSEAEALLLDGLPAFELEDEAFQLGSTPVLRDVEETLVEAELPSLIDTTAEELASAMESLQPEPVAETVPESPTPRVVREAEPRPPVQPVAATPVSVEAEEAAAPRVDNEAPATTKSGSKGLLIGLAVAAAAVAAVVVGLLL